MKPKNSGRALKAYLKLNERLERQIGQRKLLLSRQRSALRENLLADFPNFRPGLWLADIVNELVDFGKYDGRFCLTGVKDRFPTQGALRKFLKPLAVAWDLRLVVRRPKGRVCRVEMFPVKHS